MLLRPAEATRQPTPTLVASWLSWKLLLFAIALGSAIAPSYDTSTTLLLPHGQGRFNDSPPSLVERLTRWDGIWFTGISTAGYSYEQSWAFSAAFPTACSTLAQALRSAGWGTSNNHIEPLLAIIIANISHLGSVLVLYDLGISLSRSTTLSLTAALLHIISPAGLFLSAPYNESPYSFLSFIGFLLLAKAVGKERHSVLGDLHTLLSGVFFGLATAMRSNGILNGIPIAAEFARLAISFLSNPHVPTARRIVVLGIAGILVASGSLVPQFMAYQTFCSGESGAELRPWCQQSLPSIYTYVQERYWGVGFLRYWTPNNIPNFILGGPMIAVLIKSAIDVIRSPFTVVPCSNSKTRTDDEAVEAVVIVKRRRFLLQTMAVSQLLLAVLSVTNYHVQIITRLSSGYPVWYLWLATCLGDKSRARMGEGVVGFMVMYACIQGVLFASFLPPA